MLKQLDIQTTQLIERLDDLRSPLQEDFYRSVREKNG